MKVWRPCAPSSSATGCDLPGCRDGWARRLTPQRPCLPHEAHQRRSAWQHRGPPNGYGLPCVRALSQMPLETCARRWPPTSSGGIANGPGCSSSGVPPAFTTTRPAVRQRPRAVTGAGRRAPRTTGEGSGTRRSNPSPPRRDTATQAGSLPSVVGADRACKGLQFSPIKTSPASTLTGKVLRLMQTGDRLASPVR